MFAGFRAQIDQLAQSGAIEAWAKKAVFFAVDAFTFLTRQVATLFSSTVFVVVDAMQVITRTISESLATAMVTVGNMTISFAGFLSKLEQIPLLGRLFEGMSTQVLQAGGDLSSGLMTASGAMAKLSESIKVPEGLTNISNILNNVATQTEQFAAKAKTSFDQVRQEVQKVTVEGGGMGESMQKMTTETGEVVTVAGNIGAKFDQATGQIKIMNTQSDGHAHAHETDQRDGRGAGSVNEVNREMATQTELNLRNVNQQLRADPRPPARDQSQSHPPRRREHGAAHGGGAQAAPANHQRAGIIKPYLCPV